MSHWKAGKLELKCSLAVLKKALKNIKSPWEQYMRTSESGDLVIHNRHTNRDQGGFHLMVSVDAPGISYADIGFKRLGDGSWETQIDETYLNVEGVNTLQGAIEREVAIMRQAAIAAAQGGHVVGSIDNLQVSGGKKRFRVRMPVGDQYKA